MKPIKLIMSAFGPYADKVEISFAPFEEKGLFLIAGDTGAGKTTIFDAICYALYGDTSGSYRDPNRMRSDYADSDAESYVDFYFTHQGRDYHVHRKPTYLRPKKRGEGMIEEKGTAQFYEGTAKPIEGITEVNTRVRELLHIDRNQFKQIAMIAQGEFWALLNAKTEERTKILRTIFNTKKYNDVGDKLQEHLKAATATRKSVEQSMLQCFQDVDAEQESEEALRLNELQEKAAESKSAWNAEEFLEVITQILQADEARLQNAGAERAQAEKLLRQTRQKQAVAVQDNKLLARVDELRERAEQLAARAETIQAQKAALERQKTASRMVNPVYEQMQGKQKECADTAKQITDLEAKQAAAHTEMTQAEEHLKQAEGCRASAEQMQKKAEQIDAEKEQYTRRDQLRAEIGQLTKQSEDLTGQEQALAAKEQSLREEIASYEKTVGDLQGKPKELQDAKLQEVQLSHVSEDMEKLTKRVPLWRKSATTLQRKQEAFQEAWKTYEDKLKEKTEAEKTLAYNRAGLLALQLKEGEKCPVCGSVHHPEPAKLTGEMITEEEYQVIADAFTEIDQKKNEADAAVNAANATLQEQENGLRADILACIKDSVDVDAEKSTSELVEILAEEAGRVHSRREDCAKQVKILEKACDQLTQTQKKLDEARGERTAAINSEREQNLTKQRDNAQKLAAAQATLKTCEQLSFDDWKTAEQESDRLHKESAKILETIAQAQQKKVDAETNMARIKASIETQKSVQTKQQKDAELLSTKLEKALREHGFASADEMRELVLTEEKLAAIEQSIREYEEQVKGNASQLTEAQHAAEGKQTVDLKALQDAVEEQESNVKTMQEKENRIRYRMETNRKNYGGIANRQNERDAALKEQTISDRLYRLVSGQTGTGKITLEQYIQAAGFDGIIHAANRRLRPISDGQYELFRQEDSLGKRTNTFLDLEVLDNLTGRRRPVGNLSGGESFKASLSLALGLSDTVSSSRGGVQMDALFIDEGFGTLDRKSIDNAMDILINLSEANKLVGVISHREELVENIPQQIRVTKGKRGSVVEVVTEG